MRLFFRDLWRLLTRTYTKADLARWESLHDQDEIDDFNRRMGRHRSAYPDRRVTSTASTGPSALTLTCDPSLTIAAATAGVTASTASSNDALRNEGNNSNSDVSSGATAQSV